MSTETVKWIQRLHQQRGTQKLIARLRRDAARARVQGAEQGELYAPPSVCGLPRGVQDRERSFYGATKHPANDDEQ